MSKNIFYLNCFSKGQKYSILQIADHFWSLLNILSKVDVTFRTTTIEKEHQASVRIEIDENKKAATIHQIATTLLSYHKKDIRKYENDTNPTIDYSRDFGFSFVATFYKQGKKCFYLSVRMGTDRTDSIYLDFHDRSIEYDIDWYLQVLRGLVRNTDVYWGGTQGEFIHK